MIFARKISFIVLIEGFITLSVQILTMRQLIPFIGNSITVTSSVIGVMLLFLALGYRRGGEYKSVFRTDYKKKLRHNFLYSAALISVGLSYPFIYSMFDAFKDFNPLATLYIYLFVITSPLVFLLGQTIPVATNLANTFRVSQISGHSLFLSTLGSFAGSIATAAVLIPFLGVAYTIVTCVILLILLLFMLLRDVEDRPKKFATYLMAANAVVIAFYMNVMLGDWMFVETNAHANYHIKEGEFALTSGEMVAGKFMLINNSASSFIGNDQTTGFWYINTVREILNTDLGLSSADILVLGAGGFVASTGEQNNNNYTFVDIDSDIYDIAKKGFIKEIKGDFVAADARQYLRYTDRDYDVIFSDAYSNKATIPEHLITQGYLRDIQVRLKPDGYAVLNIIAYPDFNHPFSQRMTNTVESVFGRCHMILKSLNPKELTNVIYLCPATKNTDSVVYTDNLNVVTYDHTMKIN